jgi:hypothetical protein
MTTTTGQARHLERVAWQELQDAHRRRVEPWIQPRLERRRVGVRHPVDDFLFEYYRFRPGQLARWHPGPGVSLEGPAPDVLAVGGYTEGPTGVVALDPAHVARQASLLPGIAALLTATAARQPRYGCSALHEWAMVYRVPSDQVRHASWPLRLPQAQIAAVVDDLGLRCTHFDAFRFFSPDAAPRNTEALSRAGQIEHEQPGCLHATMDLYKWAYRLSPLIGADLIADCFALAREARTLDMQAAPYDLRDLGVTPVPIETPAGRAAFARLQRDLAARGQLLRDQLLAAVAAADDWFASAQRAS